MEGDDVGGGFRAESPSHTLPKGGDLFCFGQVPFDGILDCPCRSLRPRLSLVWIGNPVGGDLSPKCLDGPGPSVAELQGEENKKSGVCRFL